MIDSWPAALDEMERRLAEAEAAMARGEFHFDPVPVPDSLGPLPAGCRARAESLYVATRTLEEHLSLAMAELVGHLGGRSRGSELRPAPTYVDRLA